MRLELACAAAAESSDDAAEVDVSKLAETFRYDRQLLTAEETEAWLERSGLTLETWSDQLERSELSRLCSGRADDIVRANPVSDEELGEAVYPALVCSGALERFVWTLAERAAVCEEAGGDLDSEPVTVDETLAARAARAVNLANVEEEQVEESQAWQRRIGHLQAIQRVFERLVRAEITPAALGSRVDAHRMDWIRVAWRSLSFQSEEVAREAALRIRSDGESLEGVAADLGLPLTAQQSFLGELDPSLRASLFSARTGELAGPLAVADHFWLILLDQKIAPALEDPEVRRRAETDVARALVERCRAHVEWRERP